ncbi:hypothetical protein RVW00_004295 [Enterobacter bugandensis]|nr:hypothetical protein [Enterobacter bugandensis]
MKRVTREEIVRSLIRAENLAHRKTRKLTKKSSQHDATRVLSRLQIKAPIHLDLFNENNHTDFYLFVEQLKNAVSDGEKVLINFKDTRSLKACALVSLYAHIDYLQRESQDKGIIRVTLSKNKMVNNWMRDSGIWNLTSFNFTNASNNQSLHVVSAIAGTSSAQKTIEESKNKIRIILKFIREKIYGGKISGEEAQKLYAAVTESISNVGLHAYSDEEQFRDFINEIGKRWWVFAREVEEQLYLIIYDMGEGIPKTLVKRTFFSALRERIFDPKNDAEKILAAVQYGATRMKSDKHGKGLHDIKTFVVDNPKGALHIFSGLGKYEFTSSTGEELKNELLYALPGTLIQWNISLKAKS